MNEIIKIVNNERFSSTCWDSVGYHGVLVGENGVMEPFDR